MIKREHIWTDPLQHDIYIQADWFQTIYACMPRHALEPNRKVSSKFSISSIFTQVPQCFFNSTTLRRCARVDSNVVSSVLLSIFHSHGESVDDVVGPNGHIGCFPW